MANFELETILRNKYKDQIENLDIFSPRHGGFELKLIEVKKELRGSGIGTKIMRDICSYADEHGLIIVLSPSEIKTNKLIKWYKEFDFHENKGRNKDFRWINRMIRYPLGLTRSKWIDKFPNAEACISEASIVWPEKWLKYVSDEDLAYLYAVSDNFIGFLTNAMLKNFSGVVYRKSEYHEQEHDNDALFWTTDKSVAEEFKGELRKLSYDGKAWLISEYLDNNHRRLADIKHSIGGDSSLYELEDILATALAYNASEKGVVVIPNRFIKKDDISEASTKWPTGNNIDGNSIKQYLNDSDNGIMWDNFGIEDSIWELKEIKISDIKPFKLESLEDEKTAIKYSKLKTDMPPPVIDESGNILDGFHRVRAAIINKKDTIKAFIPKKSSTANSESLKALYRNNSVVIYDSNKLNEVDEDNDIYLHNAIIGVVDLRFNNTFKCYEVESIYAYSGRGMELLEITASAIYPNYLITDRTNRITKPAEKLFNKMLSNGYFSVSDIDSDYNPFQFSNKKFLAQDNSLYNNLKANTNKELETLIIEEGDAILRYEMKQIYASVATASDYIVREDSMPDKYIVSKWEGDKEPSSVYVVFKNNLGNFKCNCPSSTYRKSCSHIDIVKKWIKLKKPEGKIIEAQITTSEVDLIDIVSMHLDVFDKRATNLGWSNPEKITCKILDIAKKQQEKFVMLSPKKIMYEKAKVQSSNDGSYTNLEKIRIRNACKNFLKSFLKNFISDLNEFKLKNTWLNINEIINPFLCIDWENIDINTKATGFTKNEDNMKELLEKSGIKVINNKIAKADVEKAKKILLDSKKASAEATKNGFRFENMSGGQHIQESTHWGNGDDVTPIIKIGHFSGGDGEDEYYKPEATKDLREEFKKVLPELINAGKEYDNAVESIMLNNGFRPLAGKVRDDRLKTSKASIYLTRKQIGEYRSTIVNIHNELNSLKDDIAGLDGDGLILDLVEKAYKIVEELYQNFNADSEEINVVE